MSAVIDRTRLTDADVEKLRAFRTLTENGSVIAAILDGLIEGAAVVVDKDCDLTPAQVASILGISRPYVMRLLKSGVLQSHMVGTHHRITVPDLQDYMKRRDEGRREYAHAVNSRNKDLSAAVDAVAPVEAEQCQRMLAMVREQRRRMAAQS